MRFNDGTADRQAHAQAVRLAGEEAGEKPGDVLHRDAGTGIPDRHLDHGRVQADRADEDFPEIPGGFHGVKAVAEKVQEHLLQLDAVAVDRWQGFLQRGSEDVVLDIGIGRDKADRLVAHVSGKK